MKRCVLACVALGSFSGGVLAFDLAGLADLDFAEAYAFSTNRAAVVEALRPNTRPWFAYSILTAQNDGRLAEADRLLTAWENVQGAQSLTENLKGLRDRQDFLAWDEAVAKGNGAEAQAAPQLERACRRMGVEPVVQSRPDEPAPNTYPSVLDPADVSFAAFWQAGGRRTSSLRPEFAFLAFRNDEVCRDPHFSFDPDAEFLLPDTPGFFDAVLAYLSDDNPRHVFSDSAAFKTLTRTQLEALARTFEGHEKDVRKNSAFINEMLSRLAPGADDDTDDPRVKRAWLERILAFARTLPAARHDLRHLARHNLLDLARAQGDYSDEDLFLEYVKAGRGMRAGAPESVSSSAYNNAAAVLRHVPHGTALIEDYLAAFRRKGKNLHRLFGEWLPNDLLDRVSAETDLLSGKPVDQVNVKCLSEAAFKALRERVDLEWSKTNPRVFAANDAVALDLEVKNVKKLQVAIYEMDAFAACRKYGNEMPSDIDLEACVPNVVRTFDYSRLTPFARHTEHLDFPELAQPGLYVIECSGGGVASRAVVRKGRVRLVETHDAGGYLFRALDEEGQVVKGTRLALDGTIFTSNEKGEIAVPFASPDAVSNGKGEGTGSSAASSVEPEDGEAKVKTAVVQAGRLADVISFRHEPERYQLFVDDALPVESLVAGTRATALFRLALNVAGRAAPLSLIKNPCLKLEFHTVDGNKIVHTRENIVLSDHEDYAATFTVPDRFAWCLATFSGTIHEVVRDKDCPISQSTLIGVGEGGVNGVLDNDIVEQMFLRRDAKGYSLELRGRTGEALPARVVAFEFEHRAFGAQNKLKKMLQADGRGVISLGSLDDIRNLTATGRATKKWQLIRPLSARRFPDRTIAEGESIDLPLRDLLAGVWPGAGDLAACVGLYSLGKNSVLQESYFSSLSYQDGVLHVAPLPAGDYRLELPMETNLGSFEIKVTKTQGRCPESGVIAGRVRMFENKVTPAPLRLATAKVEDGVLRARLVNVTPATRLHLYAARFAGEQENPFEMFAEPPVRDDLEEFSCPILTTTYLPGQQLSDRLRYVLDRRNQPQRPGVMLARPSLLLNPWQVNVTSTSASQERHGPVQAESAACRSVDAAAGVPFGCEATRKTETLMAATPCYDFLPSPARLYSNLHPDQEGNVEFKLPSSAYDVLYVFATDGETCDEVRLFAEAQSFEPRDLRLASHLDPSQVTELARTATCEAQVKKENGTATETGRVVYSSLATVADLLNALGQTNRDEAFDEFAFIRKWPTFSAAEKRDLYGRHACHELDFFLHEKDPAFFQAVVAPNLVHKPFKQFLDHWLLGDDLADYAKPGAYQCLNVFEQVLLARRSPAKAHALARNLTDYCAAHPAPPAEVDRRFTIAWGQNQKDEEKTEDQLPQTVNSAIIPVSDSVDMERLRQAELMRRRQNARRLYQPPERTKEWVETHGWKQRHADISSQAITANAFWRDYAVAVAAGSEKKFLSTNVIWANGSFAEKMAALAVLDLPFVEGKGGALVFSQTKRMVEGTVPAAAGVSVVQRFYDVPATQQKKEEASTPIVVTNEFVQGRVYSLLTVISNPTDVKRRLDLFVQIPEGALPLASAQASETQTVEIEPFAVTCVEMEFYFPKAEPGVGALYPATVTEQGRLVGRAAPFTCPVVAKSSKLDTTSWFYLAQQGTNEQVLEFLRTGNLAAPEVDLALIGWRLAEKTFMRQVFAVLDARGVFSQALWSSVLVHKDPADAGRLAQIFADRAVRKRAAQKLGPYFKSTLVTIDPEETDLFEHREYWPLVNARVHPLAGRRKIANAALAKTYREFLDVLAAKPALSAKDRLLAAVYLLAQDRFDEARKVAEPVLGNAASEGLAMQRDYLRAYFAFVDGDMAVALKVAETYQGVPSPIWRTRFRDLREQAEEVLGKGPATHDAAAEAPALALAEVPHEKGTAPTFTVSGRALNACTLRAFPIDVEILFTTRPFATDGSVEGITCLKPAWQQTVSLASDGTARVELPRAFAQKNFVLEATGSDGRANTRLEVSACELEVQVVKEFGQVRVKGPDGKPVPGAYVKAYARAAGADAVFHKDGYTDRRGVFDYASVTSDSTSNPVELAVLVLHKTFGAKTFKVAPPLGK